MQFSYVNYKPPYKYTTQVGVILKREYPGLVEDKDEDGSVIGDPHLALDGVIIFWALLMSWEWQVVIVCFQNFG